MTMHGKVCDFLDVPAELISCNIHDIRLYYMMTFKYRVDIYCI